MTSIVVEKPAQPARKSSASGKLNSDAFLRRAQEVVLGNFNNHRKPGKVPELVLDDINVVWFAKVLGGWKCIIASTVAKGLLWEVTYASSRDEMYLDVYIKKASPQIGKTHTSSKLESGSFLTKAQEVVLGSFNDHRETEEIPELLISEIHVVWFAKVLGGWKCIIASSVAKGLLWEVTYASSRDEMYLDVYNKLNNIKISLVRDTTP